MAIFGGHTEGMALLLLKFLTHGLAGKGGLGASFFFLIPQGHSILCNDIHASLIHIRKVRETGNIYWPSFNYHFFLCFV